MFTINDAMQLADQATFQRGNRYFKSGRVIFTDITDEAGDNAIAHVAGSGNNIYTVTLFLDGEFVTSECTCPVGIDCKHGVAAILQLVQNRQAKPGTTSKSRRAKAPVQSPSQRIDQWLASIATEHTRSAEPPAPGKKYLLYALTVGPLGASVHFHKGYLKQNSSWGKITPCHIDFYSLNYFSPSHVRTEDAPILNLLATQEESDNVRLAGEEGALALNRMLATKRVLLGDPLRTASTGLAAALTLAWQNGKAGAQLQLLLAGHEHWQLIPTEPPYYLDVETGQIGLINTSLSTAQLKALHTMPAVPAVDMNRVALQLRQHFSSDQLPLPEEPDIHEENTPVPRLTLLGVDAGGGARMPGLRLHWCYGPVVIEPEYQRSPPPSHPIIEHAGHCYRITRDTARELASIRQLEAAGFKLYDEAGDWTHTWIPRGASLNQSIHTWQHWHQNLLPQWQAEGWQINTDASFSARVHPVKLEISLQDAHKGWFEFELSLRYGDWQLSTLQVVSHWLESGGDDTFYLPTSEGDWLQLDLTPLQPIKAFIQELHSQKKLDKPAKLAAFQALALNDLPGLNDQRAPLTRKLMQDLRNFSGLDAVQPPPGLNAQLRHYQQDGLNWLVFLHRFNLGGILADDMGLGKTLQTLALILQLKHTGQLKKPALVICPTSLAGNWRREAAQFAPGLKVLVIHGSQRAELFKQINRHDLIITTYPLLVRDHQRYQKLAFTLLAADEAQTIKNFTTKAAQAIRTLKAHTRLCLTGTPLENHLGELWALLDFALPGLLGGKDSFRKLFRQPIENDGDQQRRSELAQRVAPFMIRRTKAEVVTELPPKTEMVQYVELEGGQRQLYETIRVSMEARIRELVKKKGMARSQIEFLDALLKLRQACIDPRLVKLDSAAQVKEHAKLDWLRENLPQMVEEGRRILVFSQFTEALALIENLVQAEKLPYTKLTGKTRKRDEAVSAFQNGDAAVFLISLKAGGSGLNLTAADVVIHVDPWWNPAVENQATDRAYRIGQNKPVFVYKLVAADTVEERIQEMQRHKQALADALFDETGAVGMPSNADALLALLG